MAERTSQRRSRDVLTVVRPWLPFALLVLLLLVVLMTFRDYGITWDEPSNRNYARSVLRWFETDGAEDAALTGAMRHYGPLFDLVATFFEIHLPFGVYESRHLANALFGVLGIVFTYVLGRLLGGSAAGLAAAALLALAPTYYGHMFANPKDVPLAALYVVALVAIVRWYQAFPAASWRLVIALGVAIGLAAAVRVGAFVLLAVVAFAVLLRVATDWRRGDRAPWARATIAPLARLILVPPIAWLVMCLGWPFARNAPLGHPLEALRTLSHFDWKGRLLFAGQVVEAQDLPWDYLPRWFAVTVADVALAAIAVVVVAAVLGRLTPLSGWWRPEAAIVITAALLPPAALVIRHATLYDGMRHVLFAVPPLMAVLGCLLAAALRSLRGPLARGIAALTLLVAAAITVSDMVRLHPYQSVYFNRLIAGGLRGAAGKYDTDYWGSSLAEATRWVLANVRNPGTRPIRVGNDCSRDLTGYVIAQQSSASARFVNVDVDEVSRGAVDLHIAITRNNRHERLPGTVLHRVERSGVALAYVVAVANPAAPREDAEPAPAVPAAPAATHRHELWVPVATNAAGFGGVRWRTDVWIHNRGDSQADFDLTFRSEGVARRSTIRIPAVRREVLSDVVTRCGGAGTGTLAISSDQPFEASYRSRAVGGVAGDEASAGGDTPVQPAVSAGDGLNGGESGWLRDLAASGRYRTNLAVANLGPATAKVTVTLFDGHETIVGTHRVILAPASAHLVNDAFAAAATGAAVLNGSARVDVESGSGVVSLASIVEKRSAGARVVMMERHPAPKTSSSRIDQ